MVVSDLFLTETAELADVVLPAAGWGEKTGCFTNVNRTVHLSEKAVEPPGEARSDLDIFLDYADAMGFTDNDGAPLLTWRTPEQAFEAWQLGHRRPAVRLHRSDLRQAPRPERHPVAGQRRRTPTAPTASTPTRLPTDTEVCETYGHDLLTGGAVTGQEHRAMAPAGRAFLKGAAYSPPHEEPSTDYPLRYTTGRTAYQFHTRTKTGRSRRLNDAAPDAWAELSPVDAAPLGIVEGDWVSVESPRGAINVRARIGQVMAGAVFAPFHYGHYDPDDARAGRRAPAGQRADHDRVGPGLQAAVLQDRRLPSDQGRRR